MPQTTEQSSKPCAEALGRLIGSSIPSLIADWQKKLEASKNKISIFVPVEKRRKGLSSMLEALADGLIRDDLSAFRRQAMAVTRLRAMQGFDLRDSLEEALVLEDLLFAWIRQSGQGQALDEVCALNRLSHSVVQDIARVHVQAMGRRMRRREQESVTDGLTHLFNYRFFKDFLHKEISRSQRYQHTSSLVLIDVDYFKKINDMHGHVGGDQILTELSRIAKANCRMTDLVCRYGGEEFAILLPETPKEQAVTYCERLRAMVEQHAFSVKHAPQELKITVSVGLANYPEDSKDATELIRKADQAMYMAKHGGRNRVCYYAGDGGLRTA